MKTYEVTVDVPNNDLADLMMLLVKHTVPCIEFKEKQETGEEKSVEKKEAAKEEEPETIELSEQEWELIHFLREMKEYVKDISLVTGK
jgi:hypothetical protein